MDINAATYPQHLLALLVNISEADFVSFDLELTGIPSRLPGKDPWKPRGNGRKTLQDRYQETKEAADRYQILQVGITCGRFDYIANRYILRPYNITISPLLDERLDLEREVCIQSGAASFLIANGFDMGAPFKEGVQFLSREEAKRAQRLANDRLDKKNVVEDVQLKVEDKDSIDFVRRARDAITQWGKTPNAGRELEITTHTGLPNPPLVPIISRFEKRLVHQLVRAEFPKLVTIGRNECIKIIPLDPAREAENTKRLKSRVRESILRQTGFRWVFEMLAVDGDIAGLDPFGPNPTIPIRSPNDKDRFDTARERLKKHKPVIVGHNMFTDLVYFYRSFVGELPETLDEFREALHEVFPRIIDTKWLATHAGGDLNVSPTLQDIAEGMETQSLPEIVTHHDHVKYHNVKAFHEAGYDSLLTATIMLRIAAKLHAGRQEKKSAKPLSDNSSDASFKTSIENHDIIVDGREKVSHPVPLPPIEPDKEPPTTSSKKKKKARGKKGKSSSSTEKESSNRFQTTNMFDALDASDNDEKALNGSSSSDLDPTAASWQSESYVPDTSRWHALQTRTRAPMEMIPDFGDGEFWGEFGNTLRVFGTREAVLRIMPWGV